MVNPKMENTIVEISEFLTSILMMLMGIFEQAKNGLSNEEAQGLLNGIIGFATNLDPKIQLLLATLIAAAPAWTAAKYSTKIGVKTMLFANSYGVVPIVAGIAFLVANLQDILEIINDKVNPTEISKNKNKLKKLKKDLEKRSSDWNHMNGSTYYNKYKSFPETDIASIKEKIENLEKITNPNTRQR